MNSKIKILCLLVTIGGLSMINQGLSYKKLPDRVRFYEEFTPVEGTTGKGDGVPWREMEFIIHDVEGLLVDI